MDDIPEFVLPTPWRESQLQPSLSGRLGHASIDVTSVPGSGSLALDETPAWMMDGDFAI